MWRRPAESLKDTYNRVVPYFMDIIYPYLIQGKNVLIVAHGNSLRALVMFLDQLSPEEILKKELATGVPISYTLDDSTLVALKTRNYHL